MVTRRPKRAKRIVRRGPGRGEGVTWKPAPTGEVSKPEPRLRPFVVTPERTFSDKEREFLALALQPGRMFLTTVPVCLLKMPDGVIMPPHPYVRAMESWETNYPGAPAAIATAGAVAMYAGEIRTEEVDKAGHHVRPVRHTFIIAGGRYIVPSLGWVEPVRE